MNEPYIDRLKISNFKSIDSLELKNAGPFGVFAGANASGKSNFFDAIMFFQHVIVSGAEEAIRSSGGPARIRNFRSRYPDIDQRPTEFEIDCLLPSSSAGADNGAAPIPTSYALRIVWTNDGLSLEERLVENGKEVINRPRTGSGESITVDGAEKFGGRTPRRDYSLLSMYSDLSFFEFIRNVRLHRIDPEASIRPSSFSADATRLETDGRNLAAVLKRLEGNHDARETIREWMDLITPDINNIHVESEQIEEENHIVFGEKGIRRPFPAGILSQGTVYALSLLVAILDKPSPYGLTLIEEPERGLHPKAVGEIVELMRKMATPEHGVWVTTHSETVVRKAKMNELWLVDRREGHTVMKHASDGNLTDEDVRPLGMDEAWLSNLLGAGLPW